MLDNTTFGLYNFNISYYFKS